MISEACKNALVESLTNYPVSVGGKTFNPVSTRSMEYSESTNIKEKEDPRVVVDFPDSKKCNGFFGDIISEDPDTRVITFGQEMEMEVNISVNAKEMVRGTEVINPLDITSSIMDKMLSIVSKRWPFILAVYQASIDNKKGFTFKDLSKFVQADKHSRRVMKFFIKYEYTWDYTDEDTTSFNPPTIQIVYKIVGDERYTHVTNEGE